MNEGPLRRRSRASHALLCLTASVDLLVVGAVAAQRPQQEKSFGAIDTRRLTEVAGEPGQWLTGGRDLDQTYYSPLTGINDENVGRLGYAWHLDTNTTNGLEATPIVVDGVMYTSVTSAVRKRDISAI